ncbi:MAG: glycosyltransferase family 4 protein [Desulfobacterales bacterium]
MKIVHANLAKDFRGGERQTQLLIQGIAEMGNVKQVLACRPDSPLREKLRGTPGLDFLSAAHMLSGHIRSAPGDLIHAHEAKAAHWAFLQHLLHGKPYIITRRVPNPLKNSFYTRTVYKKASRVVAISSPILDYLRAYSPFLHPEIIPSAWTEWHTDPEGVKPLRDFYEGCFIIGHVGALMDRHKGQRHLLQAARRLRHKYPQMRFLFLGSGPDETMLRQMAEDLDNVEFLGFRSDVDRYLSIMDLFVFPSNYEGMGSTLLDAMGFGVPVIASRVGGITDIVEDGKTGCLVPPADPDAIAEAIERLYHAPEFRRRLAANASQQLTRYSPSKMTESYLDLYLKILQQ